MSLVRLFSPFILLALSLNALARPRNTVMGDWESAGNDIIFEEPIQPDYLYRYDCQMEVDAGVLKSGERTLYIAQFSLTNDDTRTVASRDLIWDLMKLNEETYSLVEIRKLGRAARLPVEAVVSYAIFKGADGQPDQIDLGLNMDLILSMKHEGKTYRDIARVSDLDTVRVSRDEKRLAVKAHAQALVRQGTHRDAPMLTVAHTTQVVCLRVR